MLKIDRIDAKILTALQNNGRASLAELSAAADRSPTPVHERMTRLKKSGVIAGYRAEIAIEKLIPAAIFCVFVTLERHKSGDFERFETAMRRNSNILECYALGGHFDYIVKLLVERNMATGERIDALLHADIGVASFCAHRVDRHAMRMTGVPVQHLLRT